MEEEAHQSPSTLRRPPLHVMTGGWGSERRENPPLKEYRSRILYKALFLLLLLLLLRAGGFRRSRDLRCPIEPSLVMGLCELAPLGSSSAWVPPIHTRACLRCV